MKINHLFLALALSPASSGAIITYNLTQNGCSVGCSVLPAGTITVQSTIANDVLVTVQLGPDYSFRGAPDPNHHGLVFNLAGNPVVTISGITSGDTVSQTWALSQAGKFKDAPFGKFEYALECTTCSAGMSGITTRSLSFHLQAPGLTETSFIPTGNIYFAVDVVGKTTAAGSGDTGNVGALVGVSGVPEPGSAVLLGTGCLAASFLLRRRNRMNVR